MAHGRLVFVMPACSADAFEAFFNHSVRLRWDTLLSVNYVENWQPAADSNREPSASEADALPIALAGSRMAGPGPVF